MSRTIKDKKTKHRKDKTWGAPMFGFQGWCTQEYWQDKYIHPVFWTFPKLKRKQDFKDHWMSTPSAWTRLMMNRPARRKLKQFEQKVKQTPHDLLEELDVPFYKNKPHIYYW